MENLRLLRDLRTKSKHGCTNGNNHRRKNFAERAARHFLRSNFLLLHEAQFNASSKEKTFSSTAMR